MKGQPLYQPIYHFVLLQTGNYRSSKLFLKTGKMEFLKANKPLSSNSFSRALKRMASWSSKSTRSSSSDCNSATSGEKYLRLAVLGASAVGKSCLIRQFVHDQFHEKYNETIEDLYKYKSNEDQILVDILDTSGCSDYLSFRKKAIKIYDGFLLVFAVDNKQSFHEIKIIRKLLSEIRGQENVPVIIVGNKMDLEQRFLRKNALECIVQSWNYRYLECSAKDPLSTCVAFHSLIKRCVPHDAHAAKERMNEVNDGKLFLKRQQGQGQNALVEWVKLC